MNISTIIHQRSITSLAKRRRFEAQHMVGRIRPEQNDDELSYLQAEAKRAVEKKHMSSLLELSYKAVRWMENLSHDHTHYFPSYLAFVNKPAPFNNIFEDALKKVYSKVINNNAMATRPNNASGVALWGARGTGKSNGLRLLTLVPALLFPDTVVSVYVDYRVYSPETHPPSRLLAEALSEHQVPMPSACAKTTLDLEDVFDLAVESNKTLLLCADELEQTYTNQQVWNEFAAMASRYTHTLLLAGNGSKVRAMVNCRGYENELRNWYPQFKGKTLPLSLNGDKMAVRQLHPLTTREQYIALFAQRDSVVRLHGRDGNIIDAIHHLTGGRLRAMQCDNYDSSFVSLPRHDSAAFFVLNQLANAQSTRRLSSPFDLVAVNEEKVLEWLQSWADENPKLAEKSSVDINVLLDDNILALTEQGTFTFSVPDYYRLIIGVAPPYHPL